MPISFFNCTDVTFDFKVTTNIRNTQVLELKSAKFVKFVDRLKRETLEKNVSTVGRFFTFVLIRTSVLAPCSLLLN